MSKFVDPGFKASSALAKIMSEITRVLSSSLVLPFDVVKYADELHKQFNNFKKQFGEKLSILKIGLNDLDECVSNFNKTAQDFGRRLSSIDRSK